MDNIMEIKKILYVFFAAVFSLSILGCEEEPAPKKQNVEFIVRVSEVSFDYARITVKHNGPEDVTWYGFLTTDVERNEFEIFYEKYSELSLAGKSLYLRKEQERNILLEDLDEETSYKYLTFGIKENGELYDNVGIGSVEFKTTKNIYVLTETDDWELKRLGRNEDQTKELIEVVAKKGGRFGWNYISKETIDRWNEENPEGYELWVDDIYMTTVDAIQMFALEQISTIQYYMSNGYKLTDLTYIHEADKPFELDRLTSGDYYLVAYGFAGDGQHTQTYSVQEITIEEESATPEYEQWLGSYTFTGEADITENDGSIVRKEISYNILIDHVDNNHMYRIHGWECGKDVEYDWEEDIMQLDKEKGEYLAFPAYYKNGSLEIRESPMTYITFDGASSLVLGIYGYAFNKKYNEEIPVILNDTPMAIAEPISEGESTTTLLGQHGSYSEGNSAEEWDYCKMGYIAWDESNGAYQTVNPAMRFPIKVTRVDTAGEGSVDTSKPSETLKLFSTKTISDDFLKKDFRKLEKIKPEIFERQL